MSYFHRYYSASFKPSDEDKKLMKTFMAHELMYYNKLNDALVPRTKAFPQTLIDLTPEHHKLFGVIALHGASIKKYEYAKPDVELPYYFEKYRNLLVGVNEKKNRNMNETVFAILSIASTQASIHPKMRRAIARTMLQYYVDQAKLVLSAKNDDFGENNMYEISPTFLQQQDITQKRHIQLPKDLISSIKWNNEKNRTEIEVCYCKRPIFVYEKNLLKDKGKWNHIIIHQNPGEVVTDSTPWCVDFITTDSKYVLQYVESLKSESLNSFFIAKAK